MPHLHRKAEGDSAAEVAAEVAPLLSTLRAGHDVLLRKLEDQARKAVLAVYRRLQPELVARLRALDVAGKGDTFEAHHLDQIRLQVEHGLAAAAVEQAAALAGPTLAALEHGARTAVAEVAELEQRFGDAEAAARVAALPPLVPVEVVARIADAQQLLLNKFAKEALDGTDTAAGEHLAGIADKLAESVTLGESIPKAAKRLSKALDDEAWKLTRIARTEINAAANDTHQAQLETIAADVPEIELLKQWSAYSCDPRTCDRCAELDGQVLPVSAYFVVGTWKGLAPPQHPNCRCVVTAYSERWSLKTAKATVAAPPPADGKQGTRPAARRRRPKEKRMVATKARPGVEYKQLAFSEFKMLDDEAGTFSGYAAVFGNVDAYGDVIQPGAFKDWLAAAQLRGKKIPILWQHDPDEPIGVCDPSDLEEDAHGLRVKKATLVLSVQRAQEARDLMLAEAIDSLSIGYTTDEKDSPSRGSPAGARRLLLKLTLWEFSPVTFPANTQAAIDGVKAAGPDATKGADFAATLSLQQRESDLWTERWQISDAIGQVMRCTISDEDMTREDKLALLKTSFEQYGAAMLTWCGKAIDLAEAEAAAAGQKDAGSKIETKAEAKAGKRLSAATVSALHDVVALHEKGMDIYGEACKKLKGLMGEKSDDDDSDGGDDEPDDDTKQTRQLLEQLSLASLLDQMRAA